MTTTIDPAPAGQPGHPGGHAGGYAGGHPGGITGVGAVRAEGYVYDRAPMLVYWETTLACGLACRHCRATAQPERNPLELTTDEGYRLLDEITEVRPPVPARRVHRRRPAQPPRPPRAGPRRDRAGDRLLAGTRRDAAPDPGGHGEPARGRSPEHQPLASTAPTPSATTASGWSRARSTRRSRPQVGARRGAADPGQHARHRRDARRPAGRLRAAPGHGHHALEPVHADHDGAGERAARGHARPVGEAQRLAVRAVGTAPFQVKTTEATHYRRLAIGQMQAAGHGPRGDPQDLRRARLRDPGRQRDRVRQPRRDGQPVGLPADPAGQRPDRVDRGPVPRPRGHARRCATPRGSRAAAAPASTRGCAAARGRAPTPGRATRSRPIRCARTSPRATAPAVRLPGLRAAGADRWASSSSAAGITGLAAARALGLDGVPVTLVEAGPRLGGKVATERPTAS